MRASAVAAAVLWTSAASAGELRIETLTAAAGEKALLAADLDGDGALDLAAAERELDRVAIFRGDGRGGFAAPAFVSAGDAPSWLAAADLDADGRSDLAVANHEAAYVTVLLGGADGRFRPASGSPLPIATAPHSHVIAAADVDGDGAIDLVLDSRDEGGVAVLRGLGGGAFEAPGLAVDVGGTPYLGFGLGDLDGDGRPDLVTPNAGDVGILMNRSADAIAFELVQSVRVPSPFAVALADLDGDGAPEIVAASEGADSVALARADAGAFEIRETFPARAGAKSLAVGDFDGDGVEDVAVASWAGELQILHGGVAGMRAERVPLDALVAPWGLAAGDFDADGRPDLAVADGAGKTINVYFFNGE